LCQHELSHGCQLVIANNVFPLHLKLQRNYNGDKKKSSLMDEWKEIVAWCYNNNCKLVALALHNSCYYIVVIKLHELHMYMIPHMLSCIHCNSCNLSNSIHAIEIRWVAMKLQMVIAIQKPNCKSPYFSYWNGNG